MKTVKTIRANPLIAFFILAFVMTWALWIPALATKLNGGIPALGPDSPVGQVARWSPGIAAILLAFALAGKQGLKTLFQPMGVWRLHPGWFLIAVLLPPVIFFAARFIDLAFGDSYQVLYPLASITAPLAFVIPIAVISAIPGAFAEELGWRGFALPRLQTKASALVTSIIVALVWGIWHVPSMVYFGETQAIYIVLAVLNFIPITILYTWMYNNTRGSLLLVTLFHVSQQLSNYFLGLIPTATDEILIWIIAAAVILLSGMQRKRAEVCIGALQTDS